MRAAIMQNWQMQVDDLPDPVPGSGQVLTKVLACGICGSDLHMLRHGAEVREMSKRFADDTPPDPATVLKVFSAAMYS